MTKSLALAPDTWMAFESRLRGYVRRRVGAASEDDVLGDILLRFVQHRAELEATERPSAWMLRVAANAIADHYRRRAVEQRVIMHVEAEEQREAESATETNGEASRELAQCLLPLIRCLPESYRDALRLTDIEGLTDLPACRWSMTCVSICN